MMYQPDYPYKDLTDSCSTQDVLEETESILSSSNSNDTNATAATSATANDLLFSTETLFLDNFADQNAELYIVQSDNLLNYEHNLLDENTVNQFLLPLHVSSTEHQDKEDKGPDLLALQSCVICHELFTSEADLLDHTISVHGLNDSLEQSPLVDNLMVIPSETDGSNNCVDLQPECWLVCDICERVLSTALEVQPAEQLCCTNAAGLCEVSSRKLDTMYVCEVCNGLFAAGDALDRHRLLCYGPEQEKSYQQMESTPNIITLQGPEICFSCDACLMQFTSTEDLKRHRAFCRPMPQPTLPVKKRPYVNNNNAKMWNCGSCNQLFATARELYRHKRGEDRAPGDPLLAFVCEECDKVLGSMCALHTHKKMHKTYKPGYPCRVCGRRFNQSGHLAIHMRMHTGERPYPCDFCPKAFKVKVERDDHRRTHTGERPFACAHCPKTFTAAARLREHSRIHTDQRPYRCDICGAAFRRPYARTVHTLIHTGEKPHECDICGTAFRRSGDMWKHKRTLHS